MLVDVVVRDVAVLPLADEVGQFAEGEEVVASPRGASPSSKESRAPAWTLSRMSASVLGMRRFLTGESESCSIARQANRNRRDGANRYFRHREVGQSGQSRLLAETSRGILNDRVTGFAT